MYHHHHHASALSNRGPILEVLKLANLNRTMRKALEVASSTGAHLEVFAPCFPEIVWQPTEYVPPTTTPANVAEEEEKDKFALHGKIGPSLREQHRDALQVLNDNLKGIPNVLRAAALDLTSPSSIAAFANQSFDLIHAGNVCHVAPYPSATLGLFKLASTALNTETGLLMLYGPFKRNGDFASTGDLEFDALLRGKNAEFGLRDLQGEILPLATTQGLGLKACIQMPANNLLLVFAKL